MKQRQLLINPKLRIAASLAVFYLLFFLVAWAILPLRWAIYNEDFTLPPPIYQKALVYVGLALFAGLVVLVAYFWTMTRLDAILKRLDEVCWRILQGENNARFEFRRQREFGPFAQVFNEFVDTNNRRKQGAQSTLRNLQDQLQSLSANPSVTDLHGLLETISRSP